MNLNDIDIRTRWTAGVGLIAAVQSQILPNVVALDVWADRISKWGGAIIVLITLAMLIRRAARHAYGDYLQIRAARRASKKLERDLIQASHSDRESGS